MRETTKTTATNKKGFEDGHEEARGEAQRRRPEEEENHDVSISIQARSCDKRFVDQNGQKQRAKQGSDDPESYSVR